MTFLDKRLVDTAPTSLPGSSVALGTMRSALGRVFLLRSEAFGGSELGRGLSRVGRGPALLRKQDGLAQIGAVTGRHDERMNARLVLGQSGQDDAHPSADTYRRSGRSPLAQVIRAGIRAASQIVALARMAVKLADDPRVDLFPERFSHLQVFRYVERERVRRAAAAAWDNIGDLDQTVIENADEKATDLVRRVGPPGDAGDAGQRCDRREAASSTAGPRRSGSDDSFAEWCRGSSRMAPAIRSPGDRSEPPRLTRPEELVS